MVSTTSFAASLGSALNYVTSISLTSSRLSLMWYSNFLLMGICMRHETSSRVMVISPRRRWKDEVSEFHLSINVVGMSWFMVMYAATHKMTRPK